MKNPCPCQEEERYADSSIKQMLLQFEKEQKQLSMCRDQIIQKNRDEATNRAIKASFLQCEEKLFAQQGERMACLCKHLMDAGFI